jgi:hypothetical protein
MNNEIIKAFIDKELRLKQEVVISPDIIGTIYTDKNRNKFLLYDTDYFSSPDGEAKILEEAGFNFIEWVRPRGAIEYENIQNDDEDFITVVKKTIRRGDRFYSVARIK